MTNVKRHPTYQAMIESAITSLHTRRGSSRPAIKKYILENYDVDPGTRFDHRIALTIRRGVEKNIFIVPKGLSGVIRLAQSRQRRTRNLVPEKVASPSPPPKASSIQSKKRAALDSDTDTSVSSQDTKADDAESSLRLTKKTRLSKVPTRRSTRRARA